MVNKKYWLIVDGRKVCPEEGCIEPVPFTKPERHTARYHPNVAKMRKLIQSKKTERQPDAVPLTEDSTNSGEAANLAVTVEKEKPTQDNQMHVDVEEIEDVESPPEEQCASFVFKASEVLEVKVVTSQYPSYRLSLLSIIQIRVVVFTNHPITFYFFA